MIADSPKITVTQSARELVSAIALRRSHTAHETLNRIRKALGMLHSYDEVHLALEEAQEILDKNPEYH